MRLFKLLMDCEFWPHVPLKPTRDSKPDARWLPRGTLLTEFISDYPRTSVGQTTVEVLEGEFKGYQRYATSKIELGECSALELLARAADEAL